MKKIPARAQQYMITDEHYYLPVGKEVELFESAYRRQIPVLLKGPTGCDEIVEARKDTTVVIHPLADDRRILPIEKKGEVLHAPPEFLIAISYNPGYQSVLKDLKQSTHQRFLAMEFTYPHQEMEASIVMHESGVDEKTRNLKDRGLVEGASTRLLVHAGKLIAAGIDPREACGTAVAEPLTDDHEMLGSLAEIVGALFEVNFFDDEQGKGFHPQTL